MITLFLLLSVGLNASAEAASTSGGYPGLHLGGHFLRLLGNHINSSLQGAGSHRSLALLVPDTDSLHRAAGCSVSQAIIVQTLPAEVHLDPYELESLSQSSRGLTYQIHGQVELEMPVPFCQPNTLTVHLAVPPLNSPNTSLTATAPIHARYPALGSCSNNFQHLDLASLWMQLSSGTVKVHIQPPIVLASCNDAIDKAGSSGSRLDLDVGQKGYWLSEFLDNLQRQSYHVEQVAGQNLEWHIPSGCTCHTGTVNTLTTVTALVLCAVLLVGLTLMQ